MLERSAMRGGAARRAAAAAVFAAGCAAAAAEPSFGAAPGKTLVSYAYFTPKRPQAPRREWSRCAVEGALCACTTRARYGSPARHDWAELPLAASPGSAPEELFVNCTQAAFPHYSGAAPRRMCQCKGSGRELAQFEQCDRNFRLFLARGVVSDSSIDYIFNVIGDTPIPDILADAERTMGNVRVRRMPKTPLDLCTQGETVREYDKYSFYVLINCSTRGPFYASRRPDVAWLEPFKRRLGPQTPLVGPVINCWVRHVHVQSWLLVGDKIGGAAMREQCLCNLTRNKQIEACELGTSKNLLAKGYNIASLQSAYAGVDWREPGHERCNNGESPIACDPHRDSPESLGCIGAFPCDEVFVKFGGSNMPLGLIPPATWRRVRQADRTGGVCPPPRAAASSTRSSAEYA